MSHLYLSSSSQDQCDVHQQTLCACAFPIDDIPFPLSSKRNDVRMDGSSQGKRSQE